LRAYGKLRFRGRHLYTERVTAVYGSGPTSTGEWTPAVDVYETKDCFFLVAEVAGVKREDLRIEVKENVVRLKGVRPWDRKGIASESYLRMEFSCGSFERTFTLPGAVSEADVDASLRDGVLTVRLPRPKAQRGRKIAVERK
jgi:HSP20 family protein